MATNSVNWFEIYVEDMPRAKKFYESVFGVVLEKLPVEQPEMWTFPMTPDAPGAGGALVRMPGVPVGGGGVMVYFRCDDCAVEGKRVAGAGGRLEREKISIGDYGFTVLARDTEGNMIGLHSLK